MPKLNTTPSTCWSAMAMDLRKLPLPMRQDQRGTGYLARRVDGIHLALFEVGRDWSGPVSSRLPDGARRSGLETPRQPVPRRPVRSLGQGQEPAASSVQPGSMDQF